MKPFAKILVPHDFSVYSDRAIVVAADVARHYEASITLLHVLELPTPAPAEHEPDPTRPLPAPFEVAARRLERAELRVRAAGVEQVATKVLQGVAYDTIVRFAEEGGFDLIVLGSQGRTGIARALIGSVAERVVRLARRPVLTVHLDDSSTTPQ